MPVTGYAVARGKMIVKDKGYGCPEE